MDLALIAERDPEDQLEQVFTPDNVAILVSALVGHGCTEINPRHHQIARVMLNRAYSRLQILIEANYRPMIIETLNRGVALLTMIPIPKEPRKMQIDTVNDQREKTQRARTNLLRNHSGREIVPEKQH